tara:strand:- start:146 stop:277 length:132 start_codon:yes stop_codon:yes gene_type:complete
MKLVYDELECIECGKQPHYIVTDSTNLSEPAFFLCKACKKELY